MTKACPISMEQINEKLVRLNALCTMLFLFLFIFTSLKLMIIFLTADFFMRAFGNIKYSLFATVNNKLLKIFQVQAVMTNAGPKKFAVKLGFMFCIIISLCFVLGMNFIAHFLALIMFVLASLEFFIGYCVGCKAYALLLKAGVKL